MSAKFVRPVIVTVGLLFAAGMAPSAANAQWGYYRAPLRAGYYGNPYYSYNYAAPYTSYYSYPRVGYAAPNYSYGGYYYPSYSAVPTYRPPMYVPWTAGYRYGW